VSRRRARIPGNPAFLQCSSELLFVRILALKERWGVVEPEVAEFRAWASQHHLTEQQAIAVCEEYQRSKGYDIREQHAPPRPLDSALLRRLVNAAKKPTPPVTA
jgi:hypothetical protein